MSVNMKVIKRTREYSFCILSLWKLSWNKHGVHLLKHFKPCTIAMIWLPSLINEVFLFPQRNAFCYTITYFLVWIIRSLNAQKIVQHILVCCANLATTSGLYFTNGFIPSVRATLLLYGNFPRCWLFCRLSMCLRVARIWSKGGNFESFKW